MSNPPGPPQAGYEIIGPLFITFIISTAFVYHHASSACFFADSLAVGSLDCHVHRVAYISSVTGKTARYLDVL
jgi:hypothetical protein